MNSKNKGNSFERKIAKELSGRFEALTGLTDAFRRNIDSGSFFGASNQKRIDSHGTENAQFGDIITPSTFRFCVECKHYKTPPSMKALVKQEWKTFDDWIGQAQQDAANAGKDWLLIVKFNNVDEFVLLDGNSDVEPVFFYKGSKAVALETLLEKADDFFFVDNSSGSGT